MTIDHGYFNTREDVMQDIAKTGYWPTTYVSGESPELPVHHHDYDIIGYVVEGTGYLLNERSEKLPIQPGDRLNIPRHAKHAEGAVTGEMIYIVTVNEPVGLMKALTPKALEGPMPDLSALKLSV